MQPERMNAYYDLTILKSHSNFWLSMAGVLHGQGGRMLNPYLGCIAAENKIYRHPTYAGMGDSHS